MGDNRPESSDSRSWGPVPGGQDHWQGDLPLLAAALDWQALSSPSRCTSTFPSASTSACIATFYSVPKRQVSDQITEAVIDQTIQQAAFFLGLLGYDRPPQTVFMGGGTPSTLPRPVLRRLLGGLGHPDSEEWTVEANPESIDQEFLDACRKPASRGSAQGCKALMTGGCAPFEGQPAGRTSCGRSNCCACGGTGT